MKKFTAVLLAILMLVSCAPIAFEADAAGGVTVYCEDYNPVSLAEVDAVEYNPCFYLSASEIDYKFSVEMPDGSKQVLNWDEETTAEAKSSAYTNYGYAYVDFDECEKAVREGLGIVPVHVWVSVSQKKSGASAYTELGEYTFTFYKTLVDSYIKSITPISGAPDFISEGSSAYEMDNTVFEIVYWNNIPKQVSPVRQAGLGEKPTYTIDGKPLRYLVNQENMQVYLSYMDAIYICKVNEVKEFPFSSIQLLNCTLDGDRPHKMNYRITWKDGKKRDYAVTVNSYSGYVDYVDGYAVSFSTEGSKFTSTVTLDIGGKLSHGISYEVEQSSTISRLLAKIVLFFKQIFAAVFG